MSAYLKARCKELSTGISAVIALVVTVFTISNGLQGRGFSADLLLLAWVEAVIMFFTPDIQSAAEALLSNINLALARLETKISGGTDGAQ